MKAHNENGIMVLGVSKAEMVRANGYPYFGFSLPSARIIYICSDLPPRVYASVLAHEMYHANDRGFTTSSVLWREARANLVGFRADWRGFLQGIWLSITDRERLVLYWKRVTENF